MGNSQARWMEMVKRVIRDWFQPDEDDYGRASEGVSAWELVCGNDATELEEALIQRDLNKVLECGYLLAKQLFERYLEGVSSDAEVEDLRDFLEDLNRRLRLPMLELKHIWYAEQWHDYPESGRREFAQQDLDRANLCIMELQRGKYRPTGHRPWPWVSQGDHDEKR